MRPLLEVRHLTKSFGARRGGLFASSKPGFRAVDDVSFDIEEGESVGCVGGSGSGKSTLGRLILRLLESDSGQVCYEGQILQDLSAGEMRSFRRKLQIVFQDPLQSLNPRRTIAENVSRPLRNFGYSQGAAQERVAEVLNLVGLDPAQAYRYPHEFSGGQCQRIAIARALTLSPRFLFLDEPVSALDVSIQAQILNLLKDLQQRLGLTYLFVSHDLKIVKQFCDRTLVMYRGRVMEVGESEAVYRAPHHPFTRNFLGTVLHIHSDGMWEAAAQRAEDIEETEKLQAKGDGCVYAHACPDRFEPCRRVTPPLNLLPSGRQVACHLYDGVPPN